MKEKTAVRRRPPCVDRLSETRMYARSVAADGVVVEDGLESKDLRKLAREQDLLQRHDLGPDNGGRAIGGAL